LLVGVQHTLPDNRRRLVALGGVLLIHLLIIALLLSGTPRITGERARPRETFLVFAPAPKDREKIIPAPSMVTRSVHTPIFRNQTIPPNAIIAPPINGLGLSLLQCAPENLANLSPEDRAQCGSAGVAPAPGDAHPGTVKEHAVDAATWSASIVRRNSALRVPCTYIRSIPEDVTTGRTAKVLMADALCALRLSKGSH
jgi:hypothetical protein